MNFGLFLVFAWTICLSCIKVQSLSLRRQISDANLPFQFNFTFSPSPVKMVENQELIVEFNLTYRATASLDVGAYIIYDPVARIVNTSLPNLPATSPGAWGEAVGSVTLLGTRLGETFLLFNISTLDGGKNVVEAMRILRRGNVTTTEENEKKEETDPGFRVIVVRLKGIVEFIFRTLTTVLVISITLFMGCELDIRVIVGYLKKPVAPAIGFCCQFLIMPLTSFAVSQIVRVEPAFGFGLLTIGCSPGGGGSNMWTILLHGELNLSMTMTFVSSIAAMAMMPLWTFLLGRFFIDTSRIRIPYENVAINILQVVIPVIVGMVIKYLRPGWAKKMARLIRPSALLFILYIITFGTYANLYIYRLMGDYPYLLPVGAMLPWCGFTFGFIVATIFRRPRAEAITIALETGIQNIGIALLILLYSMPQPQGDLGGVMPVVVAVFTPFPLYITLFVVTIRRKFCKKKTEEAEIEEEEKMKNEDDDREKAENGCTLIPQKSADNTDVC